MRKYKWLCNKWQDEQVISRLTRRMIEITISLCDGRLNIFSDKLRIYLANKDFNVGAYSAARENFASIRKTRYVSKARQMIDWIDYKIGNVQNGWPRYPGTDFHPEFYVRSKNLPPAGVIVKNPNMPEALINELGLAPWNTNSVTTKPVLVWFNFRASLGGELLCAKIIKRFEDLYKVQMILAGDERLLDVFRKNFYNNEVIDKKHNLSMLAEKCEAFLLARDALALTVQSPTDFIDIANIRLVLPEVKQILGGPRPNIAISWKTTNQSQGRYRNLPIRDLGRLLSRFNLNIHSAQHGVTPQERQYLGSMLGDRIKFDSIDTRASVGDIAQNLSTMDAVITIDNSILHIAGAFDIPTIGLLSLPSYWAWPMQGQNCWWYKNVTLLHQKSPREWEDVLEQLGQHLHKLTLFRKLM